MNQSSENKPESIPMRARGRLWGRLDTKRLQMIIKQGKIEVAFDLRASAKAGKPVVVPGKK